jgi:hypothetical protein
MNGDVRRPFLLGAMVGTALSASVGVEAREPRILLHVQPITTSNVCAAGNLPCCLQAVTDAGLGDHLVYVLAVPSDAMWSAGDGIGGIQFGLDYVGAYDPAGTGQLLCIYSWTLCATLEFPSPAPVWPSPGGGNLITWDTTTRCQHDPVAVAGYLYMGAYAPGRMSIVARPVDGQAKMVSCGLVETVLDDRLCCDQTTYLASAFFGGTGSGGFGNPCTSPCLVSPVEESTWSRIKVTGGR